VTNYVVVPDFGPEPFFLANYRYLYDKDVLDSQQNVLHRAGTLQKQYVKKMIPSTTHWSEIDNEVMVILTHGAARNAKMRTPQPGFLSFHDPFSVSVNGQVIIGNLPQSSRIWSCSSYTAQDNETNRDVTYQKGQGGVTLSEVVCKSYLVLLLSCHTGSIMDEYSSEDDGRKKPDFVVFFRSAPTHDISFNTFLALLMTTFERRVPCSNVPAGKILYWDDVVRMLVCQVMVQEHGVDEHKFWDFLQVNQIITSGQDVTNAEAFRIRGCIYSYVLTIDAESKKHDKLILLEELKSLTLMIWHNGQKGVARGYDNIDQTRPSADLQGWINGALDLREYNRTTHASTPASNTSMNLAVLLRQLEGLMQGV